MNCTHILALRRTLALLLTEREAEVVCPEDLRS